MEEYYEEGDWFDGMEFEAVVNNGLEDDDDDNMDAAEAAFMRGYLGEEDNHNKNFFPEAGTIDFQEIPPFEM